MTKTDEVHIDDAQGRFYQSCKFHDSRGRDSCARTWPYKSYIEKKIHNFFKNLFLYPGAWF